MQIITGACGVWKSSLKAMQRRLNSGALCSDDVRLRMRCKTMRILLRLEHPATTAKVLASRRSQACLETKRGIVETML
jgi:hypothetical protein